MYPQPAEDAAASVNWNTFISQIISAATMQAATYVELDRRPALIQSIEVLHTQFSRHQLAHSSSFMELAELIFPIDRQTRERRVDEWLDLTVALHSLLATEDVAYLDERIVEALSVYFMEHPEDLLAQIHGDFRVNRVEFTKWVNNTPWYRTACAIVLFWLPADYKTTAAMLREQYVDDRGG